MARREGEASGGETKGAKGRAARVVAAVLVAAGLLAFVIASNRHSALQVCGQTLPSGANRPVTLCHAVGASDAPVILGVVVIVLLLLPDFAEIAIPGLVSLKRRVETQEQRQDTLEERLQFAISQSANQSVNVGMPVLADQKTFEELLERVKAQDAKEVAGVEPGVEETQRTEETLHEEQPASAEDVVEDEQAPQIGVEITPASEEDVALGVEPIAGELAVELLRRAERLRRLAAEAESLDARLQASVVTPSGLSFSAPDSTYQLMKWWRTYREELGYVQAARNSVAHAQELDNETLRGAVELARKLEAALPADIDPTGREAPLYVQVKGFEQRVVGWLAAQGVRVERSRERRFDLAGSADGEVVLVELKVTRRPVSRSQLVGWIAQFLDAARSVSGARLMLFVSGSLTADAQDYAASAGAEVYVERVVGDFTRIDQGGAARSDSNP